jgi:hypothetical protein
MTDKEPDRRHKTRRSLLVLTGLVLGAIILAIYVSSKRPGAFMSEEWRYRHFVSLDEKIRRLNESPWNMEDGPRLSYPGGCGVVPYSREIVMIQQFEPLLLAVRDNERHSKSSILIRRLLRGSVYRTSCRNREDGTIRDEAHILSSGIAERDYAHNESLTHRGRDNHCDIL